ncbi:myb-related transcription factor, partner of profilin-like isoform X2 [Gouania willdenowi]|uniref:myb-related transcription factor, partner of profilin-like isoform X2 n=1 Tax=Gouania willdenowi TaxID=441366 RepID=UPI0010568AE8|nr:myb-related transcription factor, partner of profilin-like isoform X2 [Gouania willdenowi]
MVKEDSGRKRKMKFQVVELEVLVEEVKKHTHTLQQTNLNITKRNAIWEAICEKVNAVGKTKRTTHEVKRRWQDMRRRAKETMGGKKSCGKKAVEEATVAVTTDELQLSVCKEENSEILGYDTLKIEPAEQASPEVPQSPPHSSIQLTLADPPACPPAEPRARTSVEDLDLELLQQQKRQTTALEDGLQSIAHEVRAASAVSRALRRNSQAIVAHTRQLVGAVSGLTTAINALVRVVEGGVRAVGGSVSPSVVDSPVQPGNGEERTLPLSRAQQSNPRKRKMPETL